MEFSEPKEHVIARRAKPDVAISKGFHLNFVGFSPCSEGIATPVCALARNDTVSKLLYKLKFEEEDDMEEKQLQAVVNKVISRLFIELEASGRHVHVTREQAHRLFGHPLTPKRPLSQPGQFLANERVTVMGPKGEFHNVAVLGPERQEAQVEISLTDGRTLGIAPPVRLSGKVESSPGVTLVGERGQVRLDQGVIAAQRHIHLTPETAKAMGVTHGQMVSLQTYTRRPVIFEDVAVRVSPEYADFVHLDYDEANACGFQPGDLGRILP